MLKIHSLRHAFPEGAGFTIDRKRGHETYTFLHFFDSIDIRIGNGPLLRTEPHACILYNAGTPQYFHSEQDIVHDWLHFTGDVAPLLFEVGLSFDRIFYPERYAFITSLIREGENEFYNERPGCDRLLDAKLCELLIKLGRACHGDSMERIDAVTRKHFHAMRNTVLSSLDRRFTVGEMASRVGLSESRFFAIYRTLYGISPIEDVIRARIDAAKTALAFGDLPIATIAESLGYSGVTHFMRQFKAAVGTTPAAYRAENRFS